MTEPVSKLARSDTDLLSFAACANDYVSLITDRWDLVVRAGRGLGRGSPACFIPATAEIEIDAAICVEADKSRLDKAGWSISSIDLARPKHRNLVPVTTGALAHEGGHSLFTLWPRNPDLAKRIATEPKQVVDLAIALEEGRQEARLCKSTRGAVRNYLERTVRALILPNMKSVPRDDPYAILKAIALLLPREQGAGIYCGSGSLMGYGISAFVAAGLSDAEARTRIERVYETFTDKSKGFRVFTAVSDEFRDFFTAVSDDGPMALDLARYWWEMLPESAKDETPNGSGGTSCPSHGDGDSGDSGGSSAGDDILKSLKDYAAKAEAAEATADESAVKAALESEKAVGGKEATEKRRKAGSLYGRGVSGGGSGISGQRSPTPAETLAAKRIGTALRNAQVVAKTKTPMAIPPGRLRGRSAIAWSRDRSMGKATDVKLFRGKGKDDTVPPIRLGIGLDVSGSMNSACPLAASLGWVMAASAWDAEALVAGVCYGEKIYPYVEVGRAFSDVKTLRADDGEEAVYDACKYLDDSLDLMDGSGPRILVLISDGVYVADEQQQKAGKWLTEFVRTGGTLIYVGRRTDVSPSFSRGFPLPPKAHDCPLSLDDITRQVTAAIRKAYARM